MFQIGNKESINLLLESTEYKSQARTYTQLLGFSQLSESATIKGRQKFTGVVQELSDATTEVAHTIAKEYKSREEVQDAIRRRILKPDLIEPCLEKYGSTIWSDGSCGRCLTTPDDVYLRRLEFSNATDHERYALTESDVCTRLMLL